MTLDRLCEQMLREDAGAQWKEQAVQVQRWLDRLLLCPNFGEQISPYR
jgi:hypothetical protein